MDIYEKSQANDCKSACITILDSNCENPYRCCLGCERSKKCHIAVKLAHDALVGVMGLSHIMGVPISKDSKAIGDTFYKEWKALTDWQKEYHKRNPNPHIY